MADGFRIPFQEAESEFVEKRSRFISRVWRVETEEEAQARIQETKKKYYDARHNCWCYLLGPNLVRYSDDGEPQGTAGQPMLNVFQRENVTGAVCVVTRYFGGILLGAGGLTRAYSKGARDALAAAGVATMGLWARVRLSCPYPLFERVKLEIVAADGILDDMDYGGISAVGEAGDPAGAADGAVRRRADLGADGGELPARPTGGVITEKEKKE